MKMAFICLIASLFSTVCFGQLLNDSSKQKAYNNYRVKARQQKKTGLIIIGAGYLINTVSLVAYFKQGFFSEKNNAVAAGMITGSAITVTSIGFLVASYKNRQKVKALSTSLQFKTSPILSNGSVFIRPYPSIVMKLSL